jgi:excisionase family DNA binding protein
MLFADQPDVLPFLNQASTPCEHTAPAPSAEALLLELLRSQQEIVRGQEDLRQGQERLQEQLERQAQEWLSIQDAARVVGVSRNHLRAAVRGGTLPVSNLGTPDRPLYRVSREDLKRWMEERKAGPKPSPGQGGRKKAQPRPDPAWEFSPFRKRRKGSAANAA